MVKVDIRSLFEYQWCPLCGVLPASEEPDGITEYCLSIIEDARHFWVTTESSRYSVIALESVPELYNLDPVRMEKRTGVPAIWIKSARFLLHICSAHNILSTAQFQQGLYQDGNGYSEGDGESFLKISPDKLEPWILKENIGNRAGLPRDFQLAMIDNKSPRYCVDDDNGKPVITPAMFFALMSICVAWHLLRGIVSGYVKVDSKDALSERLKADMLLKVAYSWALDQKKARENAKAEKSRIVGSQGGNTSANQKKVEANRLYALWQDMADEIWKNKKYKELNSSAVAKKIEQSLNPNGHAKKKESVFSENVTERIEAVLAEKVKARKYGTIRRKISNKNK